MKRFVRRVAVPAALIAVALMPRVLDAAADPSALSDTGWLVDAAKAAAGAASGVPGPTGAAFKWVDDAIGKGQKGAEMLEQYDALTAADKSLDPNFRPSGSPAIPAHCTTPDGTSGENCSDCYAKGYRKLTAVRLAFEKLRRVNATTQAFTAKSIAFGDAVSGVHGAAGIGWQPERTRIEQSMKDFNKAYNAKYEELLGLLEIALKDIGQCEQRHFKVNDWYDRYGFMYYTFMADRYRQ